MAWIESHQTLGNHPKVSRSARLLGVSRPAMVGHLHYLWWWCLDYAQDGDLTRIDAADIAAAALYDDDPETFLSVLIEVGFIDQADDDGLRLHDWHDYAGKLLDQRQRNAERQARHRARHADAQLHNDDVPVTSPLRNGPTVPLTVPKINTPPVSTSVLTSPQPGEHALAEPLVTAADDDPPALPAATIRSTPKPKDEPAPAAFMAFWQAFPRKEARQSALASWRKLRLTPDEVQAVMDGLARWGSSRQWLVDQVIPHASTWLNQRRWEDEPEQAGARASPGRPRQNPAGEASAAVNRVFDTLEGHDDPRPISVSRRLASSGRDVASPGDWPGRGGPGAADYRLSARVGRSDG